jgi:hypothetical protein
MCENRYRGEVSRREHSDAHEEREQQRRAQVSHCVYTSFTATIENMVLAA